MKIEIYKDAGHFSLIISVLILINFKKVYHVYVMTYVSYVWQWVMRVYGVEGGSVSPIESRRVYTGDMVYCIMNPWEWCVMNDVVWWGSPPWVNLVLRAYACVRVFLGHHVTFDEMSFKSVLFAYRVLSWFSSKCRFEYLSMLNFTWADDLLKGGKRSWECRLLRYMMVHHCIIGSDWSNNTWFLTLQTIHFITIKSAAAS